MRGSALIEALVSAALIATVVAGLGGAFTLALRTSLANTGNLHAALLAEEGLEAVRSMRDASWSANIAPKTSGVPFYIAFSGNVWSATSTNAYVGGFERTVTLYAVNRDPSQNIVQSGGTPDPNTKKATVTISWREQQATTTRTLSTYLMNIFEN